MEDREDELAKAFEVIDNKYLKSLHEPLFLENSSCPASVAIRKFPQFFLQNDKLRSAIS